MSDEVPSMGEVPSLGVDTSSPAPLQRRESIEKHLQTRPSPQDLKNRNILRDTTAAPSLQAAQYELERQRATDSLRKGLERRPERDELVERNILPDSTAAPGIQGNQKELERSMRRDSLEQKLAKRPLPAELVKEGILEADESPLQD